MARSYKNLGRLKDLKSGGWKPLGHSHISRSSVQCDCNCVNNYPRSKGNPWRACLAASLEKIITGQRRVGPGTTIIGTDPRALHSRQRTPQGTQAPLAHWCMDRQRRSASKITDYRKFHLAGDLEQVVQGKVSETIERLEATDSIMNTPSVGEEETAEQLEQLLKEQRESSARLQQQAETMKLRNALEVERLQEEQWELAISELKNTRETMKRQHEANMDRIHKMTEENTLNASDQAVAWLQTQLGEPHGRAPTEEESEKDITLGTATQAVRGPAEENK